MYKRSSLFNQGVREKKRYNIEHFRYAKFTRVGSRLAKKLTSLLHYSTIYSRIGVGLGAYTMERSKSEWSANSYW